MPEQNSPCIKDREATQTQKQKYLSVSALVDMDSPVKIEDKATSLNVPASYLYNSLKSYN